MATKKPVRNTDSRVADESPASSFPIIGIGCSAGGLDALEKFFSHVPPDSGIAFIVVQHLAPDHTSALPDLLRRFTSMGVIEVRDGMAIQADCVYIIAPGKDLSLFHGKLHLLDFPEAHGLHLPIDFFFHSLAEDQQAKAIGVILSGMGSDGVLGLRAIKAKNGLTLVQEPASAGAEGMPKSAIDNGLADMIAPPEALPGLIADHLGRPALPVETEVPAPPEVQSALERIVILLRERGGNDFSQYKINTLQRRIERRMTVHQIAAIDDYVRYLRNNPAELDLLFKELLIGVTNFFRDPEVWEYLRTEALPALLIQYPTGHALRAWVPACSTGEEAYSLAIVFKEVLEKLKPAALFSLQIYATVSIQTPSTLHARGSIRPRSRRTFRLNGWRVISQPKMVVTSASARKSVIWWCLPHRTSSVTRPSPNSTSSPAATC